MQIEAVSVSVFKSLLIPSQPFPELSGPIFSFLQGCRFPAFYSSVTQAVWGGEKKTTEQAKYVITENCKRLDNF